MKIRQNRHTQEFGAVSLFVVMFTAMLFAAVTVGFTVLMLSDQQQATDNDLAQSALDSASAGAEDAKRVLVQYTDCIERNVTGDVNCSAIIAAVAAGKCNTVNMAMGEDPDSERLVQTAGSEDDRALQQAYTCVKITPDTNDYVGTIRSEGDIRLIPIKTDGAPVVSVKVQWLAPKDLTADNIEDTELELDDKPGTAGQPGTMKLPTKQEWEEANKGAMLRVGSMQYQPGDVNINEIDKQSRAVYLHPELPVMPGANEIDLATVDIHQPLTDLEMTPLPTPNKPQPSNCRLDGNRDYLCETNFILPPGDATTARYLTIASVYRNASFRVTLENAAGEVVKFRNVQPQIDVTGRANDVFRRIVSRVESADASEAPYPRVALGSQGDICKHYLITDDPDDYVYQGDTGCSTAGAITNPDIPVATP